MEALIGQKLPPYTCDEETVLVLQERVGEAQRMAAREMREVDSNRRVGTIFPQCIYSVLHTLLRMQPVVSLVGGNSTLKGFVVRERTWYG